MPTSRATGERPRLGCNHFDRTAENNMSKGLDSKKSQKKQPAKTLKEKRAAKNEKKKDK